MTGCDVPFEVYGGYFETNGLDIGSEVKYFCNKGHDLLGEDKQVCAIYNDWMGIQPECKSEYVFC
jgi:hypothetical protein